MQALSTIPHSHDSDDGASSPSFTSSPPSIASFDLNTDFFSEEAEVNISIQSSADGNDIPPDFSPITSPTGVRHDNSGASESNAPVQRNSSPALEEERNWYGFKIVGDNIDKNIRRRHVRSDRQTISLHYFNSYAVKDRVNLDQLSESPPTHTLHPSDVIEKVLPTSSDQTSITNQHVILVA